VTPDTWGLRPLAEQDVEPLHAIMSDPATWQHLPGGVFTARSQTVHLVEQAQAGWAGVGVGQWAVLVRDVLVGVGGVTPHDGWWNLGFRLTPAVWGHGLATWVAEVGIGAAGRTRPEWPIVARSLSTNPASTRVSEAAGLTLVLEDGPLTGVRRIVHADRPLESTLLRDVVALG
jgi:RimJ/RimL family protein N-acetyltransferase